MALVPCPPALALGMGPGDVAKTRRVLHARGTGWLVGGHAPHALVQGLLPAKPCPPALGAPQTGPGSSPDAGKVTPLLPTPVSEQLDFSGYMCATV